MMLQQNEELVQGCQHTNNCHNYQYTNMHSQNVSCQHSNLPVHIDTRNAHDWLDQNLHSVLIKKSVHYVNFVIQTQRLFFSFLTFSSDFHYYSHKKCILVYSEPVTNQTS